MLNISENSKYIILKNALPQSVFNRGEFWSSIPSLHIENYLWIINNWRPNVQVKVCYSDESVFVYFKVEEDEVTAKYTDVNDPVHKDSCVEFFINPFPNNSDAYFNFEINAIGTIHVGFGSVGKRKTLSIIDINNIEIFSTLNKPTIGKYGGDYWEIFYRVPVSLFEKYYRLKFVKGKARGNFYKCGDDSKLEHYGVWNPIESSHPNFHLPKYFGDLVFEK